MGAMAHGWIDIAKHPPGEPDRIVLVWHVYSGAMAFRAVAAAGNRFVTHWREVDSGAWIQAKDRRPAARDADPTRCVLAMSRYGEIQTAGWRRIGKEIYLTHWQRLPEPPEGHGALRERATQEEPT